MVDHQFGGEWTERKLEKVRKYLPAYMHVLSGKGFITNYIDAFAGTGYRTISKDCPDEPGLFEEFEETDVRDYRDGSARIALRTNPPFDKYIFIEKGLKKYKALRELKDEVPDLAQKIDIRNGDANETIATMCSGSINWKKNRAVMFLDPFGMQVEWKTIELIAGTKAIDLWYLFPIGSVNRLLEKDRCHHLEFAECLDRTLGAQDWRTKFYNRSPETTLFDEDRETMLKDATFSSIGEYIIKRLETVFSGVVKVPYILRNSKNTPLFMLCFAVGNPNAKTVALRIARDILMKD